MTEESFSLRHNPLGIHTIDGQDIVIGKSPRRMPVTMTTTTDPVMMKAKGDYLPQTEPQPAQKTYENVDDQLADLGISGPLEDQISFDFGSNLGDEMSTVLTRKNTITVKKSASQPTNLTYTKSVQRTPFLAQRLRSIRKRVTSRELREVEINEEDDDLKRAEELPEDVRQMIGFSPTSDWLTSESEFEEGDEVLNVAPKMAHSVSVPTGIHSELNPFVARAAMKETISRESSPGVNTLSSLTEDEFAPAGPSKVIKNRPVTIDQLDPVQDDDRGRLFLQINKLANFKGLPIDVSRKPKFTLSLDNGLQTVTTDPSPLPGTGINGSITARIGQEFELTVAKDLELILTINVSMESLSPPPKPTAPKTSFIKTHQTKDSASSNDTTSTSGSGSHSPLKKNFKNFLLRSPKKKTPPAPSPKKKTEDDDRVKRQEESNEREKEQHRRDMQEYTKRSDMWKGITGTNGEYCRGYMFESHYEKDIFGKAKSYAIPLYNEWDTKASIISDNKVPKPVCELHVTMMYVPKLYASEQLPMSLADCEKAISEAIQRRPKNCEGFLTQQGGDCGNYWRRRYYKLRGNELISHHEATHKRRAIIHLENVTSVSEKMSDHLWSIYEDRSFQMNFDDGESIGFYADTIEARDAWLSALKDGIAKSNHQHSSWTDLVIQAKE